MSSTLEFHTPINKSNGKVAGQVNRTVTGVYCDSPEDGPKGPKHIVSEIVKNTSIKTLNCDCRCMFIKLYIHYATGYTPQE
jgi:hypothetical protein